MHTETLPDSTEAVKPSALTKGFRFPFLDLKARYEGKAIGALGTVGCFSFFPSKNLGGACDGGMITTNNAALAEKVRKLRVHGSAKKYQYDF